jgi:hypothetical protein
VLVGLVLLGVVGWLGSIVTVVGLLAWAWPEFATWQARRARTWLTLHEDGFEVEDRSGHQALHDSQVSAAALDIKKNLNNGVLASVTRRFTVWIENSPEPIQMENRINVGATDPLTGLINRLMERLSDRFQSALASGGTVSGDGWHLSRTALTLGRPPQDQQLPLSEIAAVELIDGQICIWQRGKEDAIVRLLPLGRNAFLLPGLVQPYLPREQANLGGAESASGLGRVLFERRPSRGLAFGLSVAGVMMIAIGLAMVATIPGPHKIEDNAVLGEILLLTFGPMLGASGLWMAFLNFRCHEQGVWQNNLWGQKLLRYRDMGGFRYSATRHYHNGAYTGTHLAMDFRPLSPDRGPTIKFITTTAKGTDDQLDDLRDFISRALASRMEEQFRAGQSVAWTSNLEFLPKGIRYRPDGWLGRKEPQLLRYEDYGGYNMQQGVCYLFAKGQQKHVGSEQCSADNFYPGFYLLLHLLHQPAAEQQEASAV